MQKSVALFLKMFQALLCLYIFIGRLQNIIKVGNITLTDLKARLFKKIRIISFICRFSGIRRFLFQSKAILSKKRKINGTFQACLPRFFGFLFTSF